MTNLATEPLMTVDEAERLTTRIGLKLDTLAGSYEAVMPLIHEAVEREVHQTLGYPNFTTYAVERFNGQLERLDVDVRRAVVKELEDAGLSQRAIAPIVGVTQQQISHDLKQVTNDLSPESEPEPDLDDALTGDILDPEPPPEPEPVKKTGGLDGKEYTKKPRQTKPKQRKEETKPRRKKLPQQIGVAGTNLRTATEKLEKFIDDDRFDQYKTELATQLASHLNYTIQACQNILTRIN